MHGQEVSLLTAAGALELDPEVYGDVLWAHMHTQVLLPGELLDVAEVQFEHVVRVDVAHSADIIELSTLVGLFPAVFLSAEERVAKDGKL